MSSKLTLAHTVLLATAVVALGACNKDSKLNEQDCGSQECPVGTAFAEYRADRAGFDLSAGADPKTYSGEVAFSTFGESECTYQCTTINPCPDSTFPVITNSCFTCGLLNAEGEVAQGECDPGSTAGTIDTGF